ncbi:hypothetical protein [Chryseobacterium taichungense]|nr:hypothetical protein [Chryseobacterium taichungense]
MVVFISSQTPFSYSDSILFISENSYLYIESPVEIYVAKSLSRKSQTSSKQLSANKRKVFFELKSTSVSKKDINQINQACFTIPKSSHYIGNTNNPLLTAVLGNSSPVKQHHKMMDSALRVFLVVNHAKKKLLYLLINDFHILKITTNHFSRPPPVVAIFY